ncbi:unnamed protein product [Cuscuta epithymum]|uniref:Geranylgeranyl transferase type-2 subunit beta n=1 Tax=Cuscuta epithymum TaxID=186058 RepID=A0AAV0G492_9ASTE|nr:unnamed protein product [Cuscuta epithymum]
MYTLSAIQVLALFDKIDVLDIDKISNYIVGLQNEDGSFSGDMWGEVDTRFSYIAISSLALLRQLDKIDMEKAVQYILSCKNVDGGFGCTPGAESHAGQIFCCVGALAITGSLHHVDKDLLGWWLCERQVKSGGLNGRPEKLPDVCYSWWVLSSLIMIDRVDWIDKEKLVKFILDCQDRENGGISDRPEDAVDVFHTYFGVAEIWLGVRSGGWKVEEGAGVVQQQWGTDSGVGLWQCCRGLGVVVQGLVSGGAGAEGPVSSGVGAEGPVSSGAGRKWCGRRG